MLKALKKWLGIGVVVVWLVSYELFIIPDFWNALFLLGGFVGLLIKPSVTVRYKCLSGVAFFLLIFIYVDPSEIHMVEERLKSPKGYQSLGVFERFMRLRRVVQERVIEGSWSFKYRVRVRRTLYAFFGNESLSVSMPGTGWCLAMSS